jgi:hypothetical protein
MNDEEIYDPMTGMKLWPMDENEKLNKGEEHMSIKTMKQALEALERGRSQIIGALVQQDQDDAIASLRQAIAEAEKQVCYSGNGTAGREADVRPTGFFFQMPEQPAGTVRSMVEGRDFSIETKLSAEEYLILKQSLDEITPPRQWVGLTFEEYMDILKKNKKNGFLCFYNLVEAKLREKNGG